MGTASRIQRALRATGRALLGPEPSAAAFEAPEAEAVRARQIVVLSRQTPIVVIATLINSAITVFVFWDRGPRLLLLLWAAALWALSLRQTLKWRARLGAPPPQRVSPRPARRATVLAAGAGLLWGAMLAYLFPPGQPAYQFYLAFVAGGMAAGAATTLSVVPAAAACFILPCLLPLAVAFAAQATAAYLGMAAMLTLFAALMLVVARGRYADFLEGMRQRFGHAALLRELAATRGDLLDLIGETSIGFAMFDADRKLTLWSANFAQLAGCPPEALRAGRGFADIAADCAQDDAAGVERRMRDGRWVRVSNRPTERGGLVSVYIDISDLKEREAALAAAGAEKDVLLREMEHRVQNALATVQAVAEHTLTASSTMAEFGEVFRARLASLARAHRTLAAGDWRAADLGDLVRETVAPFAGADGARVRIEGERVEVPAKMTLALGLVLHELATNAAKHGAWSGPAGRVEISFDLDRGAGGPRLRLRWREIGAGPPQTPWREGFGMGLIRQTVEYQFGGEARMKAHADGVEWDIAAPWPSAQIEASAA